MNITSGIWTPCYKLVIKQGERYFSFNASPGDLLSHFAFSKSLPIHTLEYHLYQTAFPPFGKLFGFVDKALAIAEGGTTVIILKGLGLNVVTCPEFIGDWSSLGAMKDYWEIAYPKNKCIAGVCMENMYKGSMLMDMFIPLREIK